MATLSCKSCKKKFLFSRDEDLCECPSCGFEQPTGRESSIRKRIEGLCRTIDIPSMTVGRAVGFASAIYEFSTHNDRIDVSGIETRLQRKTGVNTGMEKSSLKMLATRANGGLVDSRVGLMIYVVSGKMEGREWNTAYIVFRGSRGTAAGDGANPQGAGWDSSSGDGAHNLDWAANFTNQQVPAPWFAGVKVHKGFLEIYSSVGQLVRNEVVKLAGQMPNLQVVCTGHSLGAALATLCAHDLEHSTPIRPFCYPFCPPKTGNLAFARNFDLNIASKMEVLNCEPGRRFYCRGISFVQSTDPVSWGGAHGFQNVRPDRIQAIADSGNTVKQGIYSVKKTKSKTTIYYLAPNVYRVSVMGMHSYKKMESELLGKRGV
jgi:hypothetical protein